MSSTLAAPSFLATRRGKLTLALLCAVAFLDFVDASIVNIALPYIRERPGLLRAGPAVGARAATCSPTAASCCSAAAPPTCSAAVACSSPAPCCSASSSLVGGFAAERGRAGRRPARPGARRGDDAARPRCRS